MSVLQSWLEKIPIRMQSTLILGLRGPDTHSCPNVKTIGRWLRGLAFKPGNPDNVQEFMGHAPSRIVEKGPAAKELEFCSQHYYSHLMHALEVVGYRHPDADTRNLAWLLFVDMCSLMHLPIEDAESFENRLATREWPKGQPDNFDEALDQIQWWPAPKNGMESEELDFAGGNASDGIPQGGANTLASRKVEREHASPVSGADQ